MRRYYFTAEKFDGQVGSDYRGNIRGALTQAGLYARVYNTVIYINDCATDNIVEVAYPHE